MNGSAGLISHLGMTQISVYAYIRGG